MPQGASTCFLLFPLSFLSSVPAITLSTFSYVDADSKESGLAIAKEAKRPTSSVHTTKAQSGISQTTQWPKILLVPEGRDITMGEALEMTILDPGLGLPAFLTCFDSLEFNNLLASHFHRFRPPFASFLRFSVPAEGLPLLEGLFKVHGDFTSGFRGGVLLGNILIGLLYAVLISPRYSSLDSLSEGRLLEWRGVVQDLIEPKFYLSFLLEYLRSFAHTLLQRKASKDLDAEIVAVENALARAHKVLQDLKIKR